MPDSRRRFHADTLAISAHLMTQEEVAANERRYREYVEAWREWVRRMVKEARTIDPDAKGG